MAAPVTLRQTKGITGDLFDTNGISGSGRPELPALGLTNLVEPFLIARNIKRGDTVIDLGATFGYITVLACRCVGTDGVVLAVEPVPRSYRLLQRNVTRARSRFRPRGFSKSVLIQGACLDFNGQTVIYGNESFDERYSVSRENPPGDLEQFVVDAVRLDDVVLSSVPDRRVNFVKLDVEGSEFSALRGAERLLVRDRPLLFLEYWPDGLRNVEASLADHFLPWLAGLGYDRMLAIDVLHADQRPVSPEAVTEYITELTARRKDWTAGPGGVGTQQLIYLLAEHRDCPGAILRTSELVDRLASIVIVDRASARRAWTGFGFPTI